jgi:hypothetical protein
MEYAVDVYEWKRSLEAAYLPGDWRALQTEVTGRMRGALLAWLAEVAREVEYSLETWCLAVNYLDRFLCLQLLAADCLQLAGLTALWLAAKQEELEPPEAGDLVRMCGGAYQPANFRHMEVILLDRLGFCLAAPTPAFLLDHLVEVREEADWSADLARHLVELTLQVASCRPCSSMQDEELARLPPTRIGHCIFSVLQVGPAPCPAPGRRAGLPAAAGGRLPALRAGQLGRGRPPPSAAAPGPRGRRPARLNLPVARHCHPKPRAEGPEWSSV